MFAMANIGGHDRKMVYRKVSNKDGYVSKLWAKPLWTSPWEINNLTRPELEI